MVSTSRLVKRLPAFNPVHEARAGSGATRPGGTWRSQARVTREGQEEEIWAHNEHQEGPEGGWCGTSTVRVGPSGAHYGTPNQ